MIRIQRKLPIPSARKVTEHFPWSQMKKGDSFYYEAKQPGSLYQSAKRSRIKITVRRERKGFRVWKLT